MVPVAGETTWTFTAYGLWLQYFAGPSAAPYREVSCSEWDKG